MWSETDFRYDPVRKTYLSRRMIDDLARSGAQMRIYLCASPQDAGGGVFARRRGRSVSRRHGRLRPVVGASVQLDARPGTISLRKSARRANFRVSIRPILCKAFQSRKKSSSSALSISRGCAKFRLRPMIHVRKSARGRECRRRLEESSDFIAGVRASYRRMRGAGRGTGRRLPRDMPTLLFPTDIFSDIISKSTG